LLYDEPTSTAHVEKIKRAPVSKFKAKDIFRASGLSLLGVSNSHVKKDRKKIKQGKHCRHSCSSQAQANNISYRVASLPMAAVFRPLSLSESRGFMKVLVDARSDRIFGFAALGPEAGELMANVQAAMLADQPYTLLRDAVFTHPTMSEVLGMLFARVPEARRRALA
jgi:Pyridine nucleotide-disulphide oxidoreductase, dimerisation domain